MKRFEEAITIDRRKQKQTQTETQTQTQILLLRYDIILLLYFWIEIMVREEEMPQTTNGYVNISARGWTVKADMRERERETKF